MIPRLTHALAATLAAATLAACGGDQPHAAAEPVPFADLDYKDERFLLGAIPFSGTAITFHKDGKLKKSEIEFQDGLYHGTVREWWENGTLQTETGFSHGKRHGKNTYWDQRGNLIKEQLYDRDTVISETVHQ